ncbi:DNA repair and recombination protein RAD26 [Verticillium dahliae VDG1]|nr:DNA repair and recombination protein RAD26 [Verticillium dahliae VDG1]
MRLSAALTALLVACAAATPHGNRFCGVTAAHCEAGCQPELGDCGSQFVKVSTGPPGSVSTDGTCGGTNGWICPKGNCCSRFGFCGATTDHCAPGCQSAFGFCPTPTPGSNVSPDGTCGGSNKFVCASGTCCSKNGFCGTTKDHCDAGCQSDFGNCGDAFVPTPSGTPAPGGVSTDGSCGGAKGLICPQGNCCSQFGFCGATTDHCGAGCQSAFGICGTSGSKSAPTGNVSTDGSCGGAKGLICPQGNCCSQFGFCGATTDHCGAGCQRAFGICT